MRNTIYSLFYEKLPEGLNDVMPKYDKCQLVTCLNPYYLIKLKPEDYSLYQEIDYIASDGMGPLILNKLFGLQKSVRLSFDLSAMAGPVFQNLIEHNEGMYVLGAKPDEVENAVETIKGHFKGIRIVGFHHGYIKDCKENIVNEILDSGAKLVIIGMGAPMQDEMAVMLKRSGFVGSVYTCGGFIHQVQESIISFPEWSNKLGLRWLYRIFTQKGMLKRLIETYPSFIITYSLFLIKMKKRS